ncbi:hypothetical protein ACQKOH_22650 [Sphingomonas sp. NPDC092331]
MLIDPAIPDAWAQIVTPAKAGIPGDGAGQEPHEIPAFAGMTI